MGRKTDKYKNEQKMQRGITGRGGRRRSDSGKRGGEWRGAAEKGSGPEEWTCKRVDKRSGMESDKGINEGSGKGMGEERVGMGRFRRQKREAGESGAGWGSGEGQRGEGVGRRNNLTQN